MVGNRTKVSSINAAYTNALLCDALDFDDTYLYAISHPGGPVIQSAIPVAEIVTASGKDIITAVILGYEVSLRVGRAIRSIVIRGERRSVMLTHSFCVFGSVTSAAKLLGLNKEEINSAFGSAGTWAPGTTKGHTSSIGATAKKGKAKLIFQMQTFLGTFAALQAKWGLLGPKDILDGDIFWTSSGANSCDHRELTKDLGDRYRIMEVGFKPTPSCRFIHPAITAVWKTLEGEAVKAKDIEEIILAQAMLLLPTYEWDTMLEAQFSVPCAVAMSIAGGEPGPDWYKTGRFKDPDIRELAKKVRVVEDADATELWVKYGKLVCTAEVKTRDGKLRRAYIEYPKWEPENPCTDEELQRKFMTNTVGILGQRQAEELQDMLLHLEEVKEVSALTHLLYSHD